jgi:hypothetical protein
LKCVHTIEKRKEEGSTAAVPCFLLLSLSCRQLGNLKRIEKMGLPLWEKDSFHYHHGNAQKIMSDLMMRTHIHTNPTHTAFPLGTKLDAARFTFSSFYFSRYFH